MIRPFGNASDYLFPFRQIKKDKGWDDDATLPPEPPQPPATGESTVSAATSSPGPNRPGYEWVPAITEELDPITGDTRRQTKYTEQRVMPPYPDKDREIVEDINGKKLSYPVPYVFDKNSWKWVSDLRAQKENRAEAMEALRLNIPNPGPKEFTFNFDGITVSKPVRPTFNKETMTWEYNQDDIDRAEDNARMSYNITLSADARRRGDENEAKRLELDNQKFLYQKSRETEADRLKRQQDRESATLKNAEELNKVYQERERLKGEQFKEAETRRQDDIMRGIYGEDYASPTRQRKWWEYLPGGRDFGLRQVQQRNTLAATPIDPGKVDLRMTTNPFAFQKQATSEPMPEFTPAFEGAMNPAQIGEYKDNMRLLQTQGASMGQSFLAQQKAAKQDEENNLAAMLQGRERGRRSPFSQYRR